MNNVKPQVGNKIRYKVAQPFIHEHVAQIVGADIALSVRQAQHLLLGGFIAAESNAPAVNAVAADDTVIASTPSRKGGAAK